MADMICIVGFIISFEIGNYGKVFKGKYRDNNGHDRDVAVKVGKLLHVYYHTRTTV